MATAVNENLVQEKWQLIKAEVKRTWSRLTNEELDEVNGDLTVLSSLIQQKYGISAADVQYKLSELTAEFRREIKEETPATPLDQERDNIRGTLKDQFRQF